MNGGENKKMSFQVKNFPSVLIMVLISVLFAVALVPTIITQWQGVNTTAWNFTGHEGAALLWGLAPFILVAGIILSFVAMLIIRGKANG